MSMRIFILTLLGCLASPLAWAGVYTYVVINTPDVGSLKEFVGSPNHPCSGANGQPFPVPVTRKRGQERLAPNVVDIPASSTYCTGSNRSLADKLIWKMDWPASRGKRCTSKSGRFRPVSDKIRMSKIKPIRQGDKMVAIMAHLTDDWDEPYVNYRLEVPSDWACLPVPGKHAFCCDQNNTSTCGAILSEGPIQCD